MDEFWYDYIKPNGQDNAKKCYMDADSFKFQIKTKIFIQTSHIMSKKKKISRSKL